MHHHAYLWTGPKSRFDEEAFRRPPHPEPPPPTGSPELIQRYRLATVEFPSSDLPPLETAYWLVKPRAIVKGTWSEPSAAAAWLGDRLTEYAPRFAAEAHRAPGRLAALLASAAERLTAGGDISLGFYLEQPAFLSLALVTCAPNRALPEVPCPLLGAPGTAGT
ncbi:MULTISPECIES: hypothetical protein [Streptomyces]|uniref:Uncharacterized protein n=1 Tax=Streptomyces eurythermus TaxID=42237 RepID=A0ABW6YU50_9ACTN|nr:MULTISPECIES: hypothetical protein [Streptomyces]QIS71690.1 hypothetical protein HB370_18175 [Streptomyces sp. DSM 40868]